MQTTTAPTATPAPVLRPATRPAGSPSAYEDYQIIRRNGAVVGFEPDKISIAMTKAFLAVNGAQGAASARVREQVDGLTEAVVRALVRSRPGGGTFHIEDIQDQVELALMRAGEHEVARAYVLYRERRAQERAKGGRGRRGGRSRRSTCIDRGRARAARPGPAADARRVRLRRPRRRREPEPILDETQRNLYDGVPMEEVRKSAILAARALIEQDPGYSYVTARLLLNSLRRETLGEEAAQADMAQRYAEYFPQFIKRGIEAELLDERLAQFDLNGSAPR